MKFIDISIGQKAEITHKIAHKDLLNFLILTNDKNALHINGEYAKEKGYKGQVAYGMLTASFISTLLGNKLPGEGALWKTQKLSFMNPVYVGDTITIEAEVLDTDEVDREIRLRTDAYNQNGEAIILGSATVKVLE